MLGVVKSPWWRFSVAHKSKLWRLVPFLIVATFGMWPQFTRHVFAETSSTEAVLNENETLTLEAPEGAEFSQVLFASYGTPLIVDGQWITSDCHSPISQSVIEDLALGQNSVTLEAVEERSSSGLLSSVTRRSLVPQKQQPPCRNLSSNRV